MHGLQEAEDLETLGERVDAVRKLSALGQRGVEYLIIDLSDEDKWVRIAAADVLSESGDTRALPYLAGMVTDPDRDVRFAAVASLGKLGDPGGCQALATAVNDESWFIRIAAEEAILAIRRARKATAGRNGAGSGGPPLPAAM